MSEAFITRIFWYQNLSVTRSSRLSATFCDFYQNITSAPPMAPPKKRPRVAQCVEAPSLSSLLSDNHAKWLLKLVPTATPV